MTWIPLKIWNSKCNIEAHLSWIVSVLEVIKNQFVTHLLDVNRIELCKYKSPISQDQTEKKNCEDSTKFGSIFVITFVSQFNLFSKHVETFQFAQNIKPFVIRRLFPAVCIWLFYQWLFFLLW